MRGALLFVLVGCGRLGFDGMPGEPEAGTNAATTVDTASQRAPTSCESLDNIMTIASADIDLAVTATPTGAALFWVPAGGGDLSGMAIDTARTATAPVVLRSGTFDATGASYVDGRLVATARSGTRALLHDVPSPMQPVAAEFANFTGEHIAKRTLVTAGPDLIMAQSCGELDYHAFDSSWIGAESTYSNTTPAASDHIEIAPLGNRAITAISLAGACRIAIASDRATSLNRDLTTPCADVRVATDGVDQVMMMTTNTTDGTVEVVIDSAATVTPAVALPVALGSAPRVLQQDGRFWLSYLDETGRIVVGFVSGDEVLTRTLDVFATAGGYELATYDGAPWIFGVAPGSSGVYARRLCTTGT